MSTSDMLQAPPNCILYCVSQVPAHVSPRSIARCVAGRFLAHPQLLLSNGHDPWASSTSGSLVAERAGRRGELGASRSSANSTGEIACWPGSEHVIVRLRQEPTHIRVASVGRMMKLNAAVFFCRWNLPERISSTGFGSPVVSIKPQTQSVISNTPKVSFSTQ